MLGCAPAPPPNLLLIVVDTLRADALSCYGGPEATGTAICALADDGTRFAWAFSTAPYTVPAVASVLTSRYPSEHQLSQYGDAPLGAERTVAEVLSRAGYATGAFVSNPLLRPQRGLDRGFAVYDAAFAEAESNRPAYGERRAADTTDAALAWARRTAEPWFLFVHYQDPHGPYDPPDAPPVRDPPGAQALPALANQSGYGGIPHYQVLPEARAAQTYRARYAAEVRYLDAHVARLVAALDTLGRRPGVLLTADHGEALGEDDYYFAHGHSVGMDQIRVPLLWRPPAPEPGRTVTAPVSVLDVAPTLLRAAGVPAPQAFRGLPVFDTVPKRPAFFAEHPIRFAVLAEGTYFARDLRAVEAGEQDPNSGGLLRQLPARGARLGPDGRFEGYGRLPPGEQRRLAGWLKAHVREAVARRAPADAAHPETRALLERLGYLEPAE